jgi:hypothetical protein
MSNAGRQFGDLEGGSAGAEKLEKDRNEVISMFHAGVDYYYPKGTESVRMKILPARASADTMSRQDPEWPYSVLPYRDMTGEILDAATQTEAFTNWFAVIKGYRFFGRNGDSFISPLTLKLAGVTDPNECADPIRDCYNWIKREGGEQYKHLIDKPKDQKKDAPVSYPKDIVIFCAEVCKDNKWTPRLVVTSTAAKDDLLRQLSIGTPYKSNEPYDPDFPMYLYGDITNPERGLVVHTCSKKTPTYSFNGFAIGDSEREVSNATARVTPREALAKRPALLSCDTLKILTYQELVDYIVADGTIPVEVIEAACGRFAKVDPSKAGTLKTRKADEDEPETDGSSKTVASSGKSIGRAEEAVVRQDAKEQQAASLHKTAASAETPAAPATKPPPPPPAAKKPAPPPPPPKKAAVFVWYVDEAGDVKEAQLDKLQDAGYDGLVMPKDGDEWKPIADFAKPAAAPAAKPAAAKPPETPAAKAEVPANANANLTAEESEELAELSRKASAMQELSEAEMERLVYLSTK